MQICTPRTASQSWNTDSWCWVDWVGAGLVSLLAILVLVLFVILGSIIWDMR